MPPRRPARGLDLIFFCVADLQTGFGPFIVVYLTTNHWSQAEIGLMLSLATIASMAAQVPAGMAVDRLRNKALAAAVALVGIGISAMLIGSSAAFALIVLAQLLHGFASCMLNPALAALTLTLVKGRDVAERLGRNARFAAMGSLVGAGMMGAVGSWVDPQAVFWLAASLCIPALMALRMFQNGVRAAPTIQGEMVSQEPIRAVLWDRRLLAFLLCGMLFHLSNAAMLPIAGTEITKRAGEDASLIIAGCVMLPQAIVVVLSPWAGRLAELWGRPIVLAIGFLALPARAILLGIVDDPLWIIPVQGLDGLGAAVFGVLTPLIAADISGNGGRFNLRMGIIGLSIGGAAALSTGIGGWIASELGADTAFWALALVGMCAVLAALFVMPETRPRVEPAAA